MTTYKELCEAFFNGEPRRLAIDRILRELPTKMKQAISDHLGAPSGYVELYKQMSNEAGHPEWQRCEDDCLQVDDDGIYNFSLGVRASVHSGSLNYAIMYFSFYVEEFDEHSIELQIKNLDGMISIADVSDAASYANAAKLSIERVMDHLENPKPLRGTRTPMGFGHREHG
jgi:hypothetical protein